MINKIKKLIDTNPNIVFVVHVKDERELRDLTNDLREFDFRYTIAPYSIDDLMYENMTIDDLLNECIINNEIDGCWKIDNDNKIVAFNPCVEFWRGAYPIVRYAENGFIVFDKYTDEQRDFEMRKMDRLLTANMDSDLLKHFGVEGCTTMEIIERIRYMLYRD